MSTLNGQSVVMDIIKEKGEETKVPTGFEEIHLSKEAKGKADSNQYPTPQLEILDDIKESSTTQDNDQNTFVSISSVCCKFHGTTYLCVDSSSLSLYCKECVFNGKKGQVFDFSFKSQPGILQQPKSAKSKDHAKQKEVIHTESKEAITQSVINQPSIRSKAISEFECVLHHQSKSSFYCDDCHVFICKLCFADNHRTHNSHLPDRIASLFKKYITKTIDDVQTLKPTLEDSLEEIKQIYAGLKEKKGEILKVPHASIEAISKQNQHQLNAFNETFIARLNNTDKEVNEDYLRHQKIKEKVLKFINEWEESKKKILNDDKAFSNIEICKFTKSKASNYKELTNFLDTSNSFIDNKLRGTLAKANEAKHNLLNNLQLISKSLLMYENSTGSSITTGQASNSILLRRFLRFIHSEVKYFKSTSLIVKSNVSVFITGVSLCGLYVSSQKSNNPNYNMDKDLELRGSLKISAAVFALNDNDTKGAELYREDSFLYGVTEKFDPSYIFNFTKGVKLAKDKSYIINIENLSDMNYCDLWVGSVGKVSESNLTQAIKCHNTQTTFTFSQSQGIQTDFDEFNMGLIEGVLYSKN